jgi:aldehyde:ferredoxin oxidoreductase
MRGYNGRILRVNLETGTHAVEIPSESFYRRYAGGRNIGVTYLLRELPARVDPLGPDAKLVFAISMLTGTAVSGQSRSSAMAKSPLTGTWQEAEADDCWPDQPLNCG